jgi:ubiquitin-protein ligase E3 C
MYEFIGKILAKAIYEEILIEPILSRSFLNLIIEKNNDFKELAFLDPDLHKNLLYLKHNEVIFIYIRIKQKIYV